MIRSGGYFVHKGVKYGHGIAFHYKKAISILWPFFYWHEWSELLIKEWAENNESGVMGPASSGKTYCSAAFALCTLYVWPQGTSIVMSSTTKEGLQLRIWGSIKELHRKAKERQAGLPGRVIESRYMLTTSVHGDENIDFRDGIIGVACKVGGQFVGISNYVGLKNDRVMLIADEASLMTSGFLDSVANLRKNDSFKLILMGNPKDKTDPLGQVCEPHASVGGWEGVGHDELTRTWKTRFSGGVAIQLCGWDTPNGKYPKGLNPFRGIITPEQIQADADFYGKDSLQFSMMNLGIMPKDSGNRRVITISLCEKHMAFEEPVWEGMDRIHVTGLDAAYGGSGGDRCVLTHLSFGKNSLGVTALNFECKQIIVPVDNRLEQEPEDQIAEYVKSYHERWRIPAENHGYDSTGRGSLGMAYARLWSVEIIPIEFGGQPLKIPVSDHDERLQKDIYGKRVTALWYSTRLAIESDQLRQLPRECAEEGCQREWGMNHNGSIDVEPKKKMKLRTGRSPDLYDSFAVAFEIARIRGFRIAAGSAASTVRRTTPVWLKRKLENKNRLLKQHSLAI